MSAPPFRRMTWATAAVLGMASAGCSSLMTLMSGCDTHHLSVSCRSQASGSLVCTLRAQGVNSVDSMLFWSGNTGEPLWAITSAPTPVSPADITEITYGVLPHDPDEPQLRRVRQAFPPEGTARRLAPGERFFVQVRYQYDVPFAACGGTKTFGFQVWEDGSIQPLQQDCDNVEVPVAVQELAVKMCYPVPAE